MRLSKRDAKTVATVARWLLTGSRLEVTSDAGTFYLGSSPSRLEPFWYEGDAGRTYKPTAKEVAVAVLLRTGGPALGRAKVHSS